MTTLADLIDALAAHPAPALTVYAADRMEFNGPVLARWFSKIANLLTTDLAPDLFDESGAGGLALDLGPWQTIVWTIPGRALGWTKLASGSECLPGDVFVTHRLDDIAVKAASSGAAVLAQPQEALAFAWSGEALPPGIEDALAAVMSQPDALIGPLCPDLAPLEEVFGPLASTGVDRDVRLGLCRRVEGALPRLIGAWMNGTGVVLVDPLTRDEDELDAISRAEGRLTWA